MTYSQKRIIELSKESPNYFLTDRYHLTELKERALKESELILRELSQFFVFEKDVEIVIGEKEHYCGWSVTATLFLDGKKIKTEDPCDLLFLELNELMLKRLIEIRRA